jgi:4-hydroxy-4-methyl-2-oxoglutarate aldolase
MAIDYATLKGQLYSAVLSDVLDGFGLKNQAMRPFVRPLDENSILFGRPRTGMYMRTYAVAEGENPYEIEIALVDDLKPNDVAVFGCNGPTTRLAPWGELLSTASIAALPAASPTAWCATCATSGRWASRYSTAVSARSIPRAAGR